MSSFQPIDMIYLPRLQCKRGLAANVEETQNFWKTSWIVFGYVSSVEQAKSTAGMRC